MPFRRCNLDQYRTSTALPRVSFNMTMKRVQLLLSLLLPIYIPLFHYQSYIGQTPYVRAQEADPTNSVKNATVTEFDEGVIYGRKAHIVSLRMRKLFRESILKEIQEHHAHNATVFVRVLENGLHGDVQSAAAFKRQQTQQFPLMDPSNAYVYNPRRLGVPPYNFPSGNEIEKIPIQLILHLDHPDAPPVVSNHTLTIHIHNAPPVAYNVTHNIHVSDLIDISIEATDQDVGPDSYLSRIDQEVVAWELISNRTEDAELIRTYVRNFSPDRIACTFDSTTLPWGVPVILPYRVQDTSTAWSNVAYLHINRVDVPRPEAFNRTYILPVPNLEHPSRRDRLQNMNQNIVLEVNSRNAGATLFEFVITSMSDPWFGELSPARHSMFDVEQVYVPARVPWRIHLGPEQRIVLTYKPKNRNKQSDSQIGLPTNAYHNVTFTYIVRDVENGTNAGVNESQPATVQIQFAEGDHLCPVCHRNPVELRALPRSYVSNIHLSYDIAPALIQTQEYSGDNNVYIETLKLTSAPQRTPLRPVVGRLEYKKRYGTEEWIALAVGDLFLDGARLRYISDDMSVTDYVEDVFTYTAIDNLGRSCDSKLGWGILTVTVQARKIFANDSGIILRSTATIGHPLLLNLPVSISCSFDRAIIKQLPRSGHIYPLKETFSPYLHGAQRVTCDQVDCTMYAAEYPLQLNDVLMARTFNTQSGKKSDAELFLLYVAQHPASWNTIAGSSVNRKTPTGDDYDVIILELQNLDATTIHTESRKPSDTYTSASGQHTGERVSIGLLLYDEDPPVRKFLFPGDIYKSSLPLIVVPLSRFENKSKTTPIQSLDGTWVASKGTEVTETSSDSSKEHICIHTYDSGAERGKERTFDGTVLPFDIFQYDTADDGSVIRGERIPIASKHEHHDTSTPTQLNPNVPSFKNLSNEPMLEECYPVHREGKILLEPKLEAKNNFISFRISKFRSIDSIASSEKFALNQRRYDGDSEKFAPNQWRYDGDNVIHVARENTTPYFIGTDFFDEQSVSHNLEHSSDWMEKNSKTHHVFFNVTVGFPFRFSVHAADDDNDHVDFILYEAPQHGYMNEILVSNMWEPPSVVPVPLGGRMTGDLLAVNGTTTLQYTTPDAYQDQEGFPRTDTIQLVATDAGEQRSVPLHITFNIRASTGLNVAPTGTLPKIDDTSSLMLKHGEVWYVRGVVLVVVLMLIILFWTFPKHVQVRWKQAWATFRSQRQYTCLEMTTYTQTDAPPGNLTVPNRNSVVIAV